MKAIAEKWDGIEPSL